MKQNSSGSLKSLPLDVVGSTKFGRYPKISDEKTFNMMIADDWLVPFSGYKIVADVAGTGQGRGIFTSVRLGKAIAVVGNGVYTVTQTTDVYQQTHAVVAQIATIQSYNGDVFMAENDNGQIAISDNVKIYIYNYVANSFSIAPIDFTPGAITFQDGYFISPARGTNRWRLSESNQGMIWPTGTSLQTSEGALSTKPDNVQAVVRMPGKGNLLLVFGSTVTEQWYDIGGSPFPYQKNTYSNIDFGCVNPATISGNDEMVVWLGANEKSQAAIMVSTGGEPMQISTDGINFQLAQLTQPHNSYGFLFKQDGHTFYQLTFVHDNLSYVYDFDTKAFFSLTDENENYHVAKQVALLNNTHYFVSINDGSIYELNSKYTTYNGKEIPRKRVCKSISFPTRDYYVVNNVTFPIEQGQGGIPALGLQRVDLSLSKDGNASFGNQLGVEFNDPGVRRNRLNWWNLGIANEFTCQFQFWGHGRFVAGNGEVSYYQ